MWERITFCIHEKEKGAKPKTKVCIIYSLDIAQKVNRNSMDDSKHFAKRKLRSQICCTLRAHHTINCRDPPHFDEMRKSSWKWMFSQLKTPLWCFHWNYSSYVFILWIVSPFFQIHSDHAIQPVSILFILCIHVLFVFNSHSLERSECSLCIQMEMESG